MSDILAKGGPMVEPLKSREYFERVFVEMARLLGRTASISIPSTSIWNCGTRAL